MVEAINQGTCTECDESEDNYTQMERTHHSLPDDDDEWDGIERGVRCDCGAEATVTLTQDGVSTSGSITLEDASWNEGDDSDESSDSEE